MANRDDLLAVVEARLAAQDQWDEENPGTTEPQPILEASALTEAQALRQTLTADADNLDARYTLGWFHLYRAAALPEGEEDEDLNRAIEMFTPCFIADFESLPEGLLAAIAWEAAQAALPMLAEAMRSPDPGLADQAVSLWRRIVEATPATDPSHAVYLSNLGSVLQLRFNRLGNRDDLNAAVEACRAASLEVPPDAPQRALVLSSLGSALQVRFQHGGDLRDLDEAIEAHTGAVATGDDDPQMYLNNLAVALQSRYERTGFVADLDAAVDAFASALAAPSGNPAGLATSGSADTAAIRSNLGSALRLRFERTGVPADLDRAIDVLRDAVAATLAGHPSLCMRLSNIGASLLVRFTSAGAREDLEAAVEALRSSVAQTPQRHPNRGMHLSNLGLALWNRFNQTATRSDLDEAIDALFSAANALPPGHAYLPGCLNNLGNALTARCDRDGAVSDLDAAIDAFRAAVASQPAGNPGPAMWLPGLGNALLARFNRVGAPEDLDAAVAAHQAAVATIAADHSTRYLFLNGLGAVLYNRFLVCGDPDDLDSAIQAFRESVQTVPADSPDWARALDNLGTARRARFGHSHQQSDLDAAVEVHTALASAPGGHATRAKRLTSLGDTMRVRFEHTGALSDLHTALASFEEAAGIALAPPSDRIKAARSAAALVAQSDPAHAASILENAVLLLPEVAPRRLNRSDQQYALGGVAGLAADAAGLVLRIPDAASGERAFRALRILEAGRAVLLSQVLDSRGDLTELRRRAPELATRFTDLRDALDQDIEAEAEAEPRDADWEDQRNADRTALAREFELTLAQIRELDGLGPFARPPGIEDLITQAAQGPVVTFNVSVYGSDAILLTSDGVTAIGLPGLDRDKLAGQIDGFYQAVQTAAAPTVSGAERRAAQDHIKTVLETLWDIALEPVLRSLGYTAGPPLGADWPRLWWATGGLLGLLPLHAAGYHADPQGPLRRTVMDRVVPSYTPTVGALRHARRPQTSGENRALIVAMPVTPGLPDGAPLPNAAAEVALLRRHFPASVELVETAGDCAPTKANVLAQLPDVSVAHFACHAVADPADPSRGQLLLHDHDSDPLTVAGLAAVNLERAQLAYLSACTTALGVGPGLADESIHLASACLLAGFPHVIGTLWEIDDRLAATIADAFYTYLLNENRSTAHALHAAVYAARDAYTRTPSLWAAYLHVGA